MFARSQDSQKTADTGAGSLQQPATQLEQRSTEVSAADTLYSNIAPRSVSGHKQQNASFKQPSSAPKSKQIVPKRKQSVPKGKQKDVARQQPKPRNTGKVGAKGGTSKVKELPKQAISNSIESRAQPQLPLLEAEDLLIQELLAGIPSTAWLPTDPLTSEGWFTDPISSFITQDTTTHPQKELPATNASSSLISFSTASSHSTLASLQPGLVSDAQSLQETLNSPLQGTSLADAVGQQAQTTPDARLMASLRTKKDTPLMSRHNAKKGNPLSGFAKKHGIGFPVGNQMAILSPALLSSSPPNAKQLRTHPYKYYSPPKPTQRPPHNQTKGRNLLLGRSSPLRIQAGTPYASNEGRPVERTSMSQKGVSHVDAHSSFRTSQAGSVASTSAHGHISTNPGAKIGIKWEIAQDKLLLHGVRQQRWMDIAKPRDPARFLGNDWEVISHGVTLGSGVARSARQCRRRWAVMHSHLGTAIMDFVDSAPTPQSSVQSTPVPCGGLTPDNCLNASKQTTAAPGHVRNLRLANLPMSSPPFMAASDHSRGADTNSQACDRGKLEDSSRTSDHAQPSLHTAVTAASFKEPGRVVGALDLDSIDLSNRWSSPAYCQLLADVVQALSNPDSEAAAVVQRHTSGLNLAIDPVSRGNNISVANLPAVVPTTTASLFSATEKNGDSSAIASKSSKKASQAAPSKQRKRPPVVRGKKEPLKNKSANAPQMTTTTATTNDGAKPPVSAIKSGVVGKIHGEVSLDQTLGTLSVVNQVPKLAIAGLPSSKELDISPMDQDLSVYLEFLRSLTNDQGNLDTAWTALFDDPTNPPLPSLTASSVAGAPTSALVAPVSATATATSAFSTSSILAIEPIEPSELISKLNGGVQSSNQPLPSRTNIDDDDANDGDFVLTDLEEFDDEYDEDDDDDNCGGGDEEEEEEEDDDDDNDNDNDDDDDNADEDVPQLSSSKGDVRAGIPVSLLKPPPLLPPSGLEASLTDLGGDAWNMTLEQLGFGSGGTSMLPTSTVGASGDSVLSSDALLQQLIQGVSTDQKSGMGDLSITSSMSTPSSSSLSAWLPGAAGSSILPRWSGSGDNIGAGLDLASIGSGGDRFSQNKLTNELLASLTGTDSRLPATNGLTGGTRIVAEKSNIQDVKATGQADKTMPLSTEDSSNGTTVGETVHQQKSQTSRNAQDLAAGDVMPLTRTGKAKAPRKRKNKAAASTTKSLSAAAIVDADGFVGLEQNGMDTEMSGLYQDALQEGEEIDVQEDLLVADNSEYMFSAEQMSQLREQQLQNFQFVTQSFLITCTESGPHGPQARHWKSQLDQLALWHSLGTRESPSDMMNSAGLQGFGELIESAEKVRARTGAIGMSESGRFVPNPVSFFAIPGITVVIPEIYEAVDEIHRTTQLSSNYDFTKEEQGGNSGGKKDGRRSSATSDARDAAEVRSFDDNMGFTGECKCTAMSRGFRSAMVRECVFPKVFKQTPRSNKRKPSADVADFDRRTLGSSSDKRFVMHRQNSPVLSARRDSVSLAPSSSSANSGLLQLPGTKLLAPLIKPVSRQSSAQNDGQSGSSSSGGGSSNRNAQSSESSYINTAIIPVMTFETPPTFTDVELRLIVEEMKSQMRGFKREVHRVPRSRRRIFVQGSDGVARLEWMKVNIEPLMLPGTMQGLMDVMIMHSGFQESMLPRIVVVRKPKNRIHFLDTEDSLLLQGLRLFGLEDVASVRAHLLPCKTVSQLRNRLNNMRARRAPPNPVKDFCLRPIAPFTLEEEEKLRLGVLVYGDEFKQMDKNFLVNRPILALTYVWNHARRPQPPETL